MTHEIARTAWEFVSEAGNADLRNRLWQAATARFSNPLMRPFLVHTNIRQAEFAVDAPGRDHWIEMANGWTQLALRAERLARL